MTITPSKGGVIFDNRGVSLVPISHVVCHSSLM